LRPQSPQSAGRRAVRKTYQLGELIHFIDGLWGLSAMNRRNLRPNWWCTTRTFRAP
jgi:hypothetical protein